MKQKYSVLLFDVDNTLLDFNAAENAALNSLFAKMGCETTEKTHQKYKEINSNLWRQYEQGLIPRAEVLGTRFSVFFDSLNIKVNGEEAEFFYREQLGKNADLIDGAKELCQQLNKDYYIYIVSNGVEKTQLSRLNSSGLLPYIKDIFISEAVGYQKPDIEFFNHVFKQIKPTPKHEILIIGDSLTADIQGGINASIDTCWVNLIKAKNNTAILPTYEINKLNSITNLLI